MLFSIETSSGPYSYVMSEFITCVIYIYIIAAYFNLNSFKNNELYPGNLFATFFHNVFLRKSVKVTYGNGFRKATLGPKRV